LKPETTSQQYALVRTKRRVLSIVFILIALLGLGCWLVLRTAREPVYRGRSLGEWLDLDYLSVFRLNTNVLPGVSPSSINSSADKDAKSRAEAREAILHIGSNAVPVLVRRAVYSDSPFTRFTSKVPTNWADHFGYRQGYWLYAHRSTVYDYEARLGFEVLGPAAGAAAPGLVRLLHTAPTIEKRRLAVYCLTRIGPAAREALPDFVRELKHPDETTRIEAVTAVLDIAFDHNGWRCDPGSVPILIPELRQLLADPSTDFPRTALVLEKMGSNALPLTNAIVPWLNSTNAQIQSRVRYTLKCIDSETFK
jgi:hypothetical protein